MSKRERIERLARALEPEKRYEIGVQDTLGGMVSVITWEGNKRHEALYTVEEFEARYPDGVLITVKYGSEEAGDVTS